jgi:hypothetical protein
LPCSPGWPKLKSLARKDATQLSSIPAHFSHIEPDSSVQNAAETLDRKTSVWAGRYAVFQLDPEWKTTFNRARQYLPTPVLDTLWPQDYKNQVDILNPNKWCVQLDHAALDIDFGGQGEEEPTSHFTSDFDSWTVKVEWRSMLRLFLRKESAIARKLQQLNLSGHRRPIPSSITSPNPEHLPKQYLIHFEDSLRATYREREQWVLPVEDQQLALEQQQLRAFFVPLHGQHQFYGPLTRSQDLLHMVEQCAIERILYLRGMNPICVTHSWRV